MANLSFQRELAARALGVGKGRIRFDPERLEDVEDAITRDAVRKLYKEGAIRVAPAAGTSRGRARARREKEAKRGRGPGSRKGHGVGGKEAWMAQVRALRRTLKELRDSGAIDRRLYRRLYLKVKGGAIRSRRRLFEVLEAERNAGR